MFAHKIYTEVFKFDDFHFDEPLEIAKSNQNYNYAHKTSYLVCDTV